MRQEPRERGDLQTSEAEMPIVPPVVYVPCAAVPDGDEVQVVFRRTLDGRLALVIYTALDRLVDCCGPHQPWILLPTEKLAEVKKVQHYDVIYLDLEMPDEERVGPTVVETS